MSSINPAVYIHIPFCLKKCGYCDFYSNTNLKLEEKFVELLVKEIKNFNISKLKPKTIFFGGGTPTLLSIENYKNILELLDLSVCEEFTIECNPDTVTYDFLKVMKNLGLSRVSIGMQSSCVSVLKTLERSHNPKNVKRVIDLCKELGLQTSLDLIYGTPNETIDEWEKSVQDAIDLNPDHISCYALTLETNVPMYSKIKKGLMVKIDEDEQAEKYYLADNLLEENGYKYYEISNWSKPGFECKHNLVYWKRETYFGFGPSAHSFDKKSETRWANSKSIPWTQNFVEHLNQEEIKLEEKMLKLRLKDGCPKDQRMIIDTLI